MRLRKKVFGLIATTALGVLTLVFVATETILLAGYREIEQGQVKSNARRIIAAIDTELGHMARTAKDWSDWDATSRFIAGDDPGYPAANLRPESWHNLDLDLLVFADARGTIIHGAQFDPIAGQEGPLPSEIIRLFAPEGGLTPYPEGRETITGIVSAGTRTFLVAIRPVPPAGDARGALPVGTLLMGRRLDDRAVAHLGVLTRVDVRLLPPGDRSLPAAARVPVTGGSDDAAIAVAPLDDSRIAGWFTFGDPLANAPAAAFRIVQPRTTWLLGKRTVIVFFGVILIISFTLIGLFTLVLDRSVILRFAHLVEPAGSPKGGPQAP